ncbi:unnamed protein product [Danaus chrysippus]|uniref:(African queen) hypothetical protein n=1 Tax=Danaus chrysippus TaxID=151541 RepID=A0A8J2QPK1_9NEOP|nr:unnamed protein product [Danaus chrysippus]
MLHLRPASSAEYANCCMLSWSNKTQIDVKLQQSGSEYARGLEINGGHRNPHLTRSKVTNDFGSWKSPSRLYQSLISGVS